MREYDKHIFFILLALSFGLCFCAINSAPLLEPLETVYAEKTSSFFPPLYFWLLSLCRGISNYPEINLRILSAVAVTLTVFSMYVFCTKIFDENAGFWSCVVLVTTALGAVMAKLASPLPLFVLFLTLTIFCYLYKKYWLMYLFISLSTMTMGIFGLVYPLGLIILHCVLMDRVERLGNMHLILGTLLVLGAATPWFFMQYAQYGKVFLQEFLTCKFMAPINYETAVLHGYAYYLIPFIIALFPWTGTLPGAFFASFSDSRNEDLENLGIMHIWWISGLIFLLVYPLKFFNMLWLIIPPLCVFLGWNFYRIEKTANVYNVLQKVRNYVWGSLITFLAMSFGWFILGKLHTGLEFSGIVLAVLTIIIYMAAVLILFQYKDIHLYLLIHAGAGVMNIFFFYIFFLPVIAEQLNLKNYLEKVIG